MTANPVLRPRLVDPVDPQAATNHVAATITPMRRIDGHVTTDVLTLEKDPHPGYAEDRMPLPRAGFTTEHASHRGGQSRCCAPTVRRSHSSGAAAAHWRSFRDESDRPFTAVRVACGVVAVWRRLPRAVKP
jgi:hypothetical protein